MTLHIDRTGLSLEAGPFYLSLSLVVQGIAWAGLLDIVMEKTACRPDGGQWVQAWRTAPGWFEALFLGHRLSVRLGNGRRASAVPA